MTVLVIIVVLVLVLLYAGSLYNRLVAFRNRFKNAYSQIDVQLKRRYDLIPNLVETAKGYLAHERGTLEAVIQARNQAVTANQAVAQQPDNAQAVRALSGAESQLTGALGRLFALAESYPDLKGSQTMASLMEELTSTENKVSFARQAFNDSVMEYNTARETFPAVFIANMLGFQQAEYFQITAEEEQAAPKVQFS